MYKRQGISWLVCVAPLALALAPFASADSTATITMTGVSGASIGNVYTGPYFGTVNGTVDVPIICDDFYDDTYFNESWTAYTTSLSSIPVVGLIDPPQYTQGAVGATVLNQSQAYTVAAYLATELLSTNQSTSAGQNSAGELNFAMWALFNPTVFTDQTNGAGGSCTLSYGCLSAGQLSGSEADLAQAYSEVQTLGLNTSNFDSLMDENVTIYTYDPSAGSPKCPGATCPPPPQEFISVTSMPEPASIATLSLDLAGFAGLVFLLRKRFARR